MILPVYLYRLAVALTDYFSAATTAMFETFGAKIIELIAYLLWNAHHAITFYLYAFHSPEMRKRLEPTFCKMLACDCCAMSTGRNFSSNDNET